MGSCGRCLTRGWACGVRKWRRSDIVESLVVRASKHQDTMIGSVGYAAHDIPYHDRGCACLRACQRSKRAAGFTATFADVPVLLPCCRYSSLPQARRALLNGMRVCGHTRPAILAFTSRCPLVVARSRPHGSALAAAHVFEFMRTCVYSSTRTYTCTRVCLQHAVTEALASHNHDEEVRRLVSSIRSSIHLTSVR